MRIGILVVSGLALAAASFPAHATLIISNKATANVDCAAGVCKATARKANLNTDELESMLTSGNVTVKAGTRARDIDVQDAVTWASTNGLTLDSSRSIEIKQPMVIEGESALTLITNDGFQGGTLSFPGKGYAKFWDTNSTLTINGQQYLLANSIGMLAALVFVAPGANYALANSYDASGDGVIGGSPINTLVLGNFEGLGNTINGLHIEAGNNQAGLFLALAGTASNLHLTKMKVSGSGLVGALAASCWSVTNVDVSGHIAGKNGAVTGGVCGEQSGVFSNVHSSGSVAGSGKPNSGTPSVGGLSGSSDAMTLISSSTAKVQGSKGWQVGGLIGHNTGTVSRSFATGVIRGADNSIVGSLIGQSDANGDGIVILDCYATGFVGGEAGSTVGGLIGQNNGPVTDSYSSGPVTSGSGNAVGGLIGNDIGAADLTDTYFDTDTSGQSHGVGNDTAYPGVTGLTTEQFQAGLPSGFDPAVWAENPNINGGLPYLLANSQR